MMKHPRLLSLLIALVVCLFVGAAGAEETIVTNMYEFNVQELGFTDRDEFFSYYVEQKLYGYEQVTFARPAYDYLTKGQQALYDMVVPTIKSIAAGTTASTVIDLDVDAVKAAGFVLDGTYTDENTDLSTNAAATWAAIVADFEQVRKALIVDHPFEFYWCHGSGYGYGYSWSTAGTYTVSPAFYFYPAENFQPAGYDENAPTVDTAKTSAATYAVTKANAIVTKYAGKTDVEKLTGYKDEICELVDYNYDALDGWDPSKDNSPGSCCGFLTMTLTPTSSAKATPRPSNTCATCPRLRTQSATPSPAIAAVPTCGTSSS